MESLSRTKTRGTIPDDRRITSEVRAALDALQIVAADAQVQLDLFSDFDADGLRLAAEVVEDDVPVVFALTARRPRVRIRALDPPLVERERLEDLLKKCMPETATESLHESDIIGKAVRVFGFTA